MEKILLLRVVSRIAGSNSCRVVLYHESPKTFSRCHLAQSEKFVAPPALLMCFQCRFKSQLIGSPLYVYWYVCMCVLGKR